MRPGEEFAPITTTGVTFEHSYDVRNRYGFNVMLDYEIPGSKLQASNLLSRLDRSEIIRDRRFDFAGSNKMRYYLRERERQIDILSNSLSGQHDVGSLKLDWRMSRSASQTRYPYNSRFQFQELNAFNVVGIPQFASPTDLIINAYNRPENAFLYDGEVEPEKSYERDLAAQLNAEWQYTVTSDIAGKLKVGGKFRDKLRERDREFASKRLDITDPNFGRYHSQFGTPGFTYDRMAGTGYAFMRYYVDPSFDPGKFLDGSYNFGVGLSSTELRYFLKNYLYDRVYKFSLQRDLDDYTVVDRLSAGYIMTELNIGSFLMILPGVRYELINIDATGKEGSVNTPEDEGFLDDDRVQDTTSVIRYSQWYPMVHVRVKPTDWFDIRLAWTKSASYPRMDYIIPSKRIKGSELKVEYGNSGLRPQLSTNYDVYLSFYGNRVGLFTVGAYYKNVQDLIYLRAGHIILDPAKEGVETNLKGYSLQRPENNPNKTEVYGIEFDWQTNFKWLPRPFDGIVLSANYAHIWSETDFPRSFVQQERLNVFPFIRTTVIDTFRTGNMPDQAADIANISLGYDLGSFSGRVSMLLQNKALSFVGVREELDGYTDKYIRWDLSLKYGLTDYFDVFCNLNNFTNQPDQSYMQTARYPTSSEYYGWTADLGVTLKF
jgi:TonB-dependent receptor